jgi:ribosomal protein S4
LRLHGLLKYKFKHYFIRGRQLVALETSIQHRYEDIDFAKNIKDISDRLKTNEKALRLELNSEMRNFFFRKHTLINLFSSLKQCTFFARKYKIRYFKNTHLKLSSLKITSSQTLNWYCYALASNYTYTWELSALARSILEYNTGSVLFKAAIEGMAGIIYQAQLWWRSWYHKTWLGFRLFKYHVLKYFTRYHFNISDLLYRLEVSVKQRPEAAILIRRKIEKLKYFILNYAELQENILRYRHLKFKLLPTQDKMLKRTSWSIKMRKKFRRIQRVLLLRHRWWYNQQKYYNKVIYHKKSGKITIEPRLKFLYGSLRRAKVRWFKRRGWGHLRYKYMQLHNRYYRAKRTYLSKHKRKYGYSNNKKRKHVLRRIWFRQTLLHFYGNIKWRPFYKISDNVARVHNRSRPLLFISKLEQRLDSILIRYKIARNIEHAHNIIKCGNVYINAKIVTIPQIRITNNTLVYVKKPLISKPSVSKKPYSRANYIFRPHRLGYSTFLERTQTLSIYHRYVRIMLLRWKLLRWSYKLANAQYGRLFRKYKYYFKIVQRTHITYIASKLFWFIDSFYRSVVITSDRRELSFVRNLFKMKKNVLFSLKVKKMSRVVRKCSPLVSKLKPYNILKHIKRRKRWYKSKVIDEVFFYPNTTNKYLGAIHWDRIFLANLKDSSSVFKELASSQLKSLLHSFIQRMNPFLLKRTTRKENTNSSMTMAVQTVYSRLFNSKKSLGLSFYKCNDSRYNIFIHMKRHLYKIAEKKHSFGKYIMLNHYTKFKSLKKKIHTFLYNNLQKQGVLKTQLSENYLGPSYKTALSWGDNFKRSANSLRNTKTISYRVMDLMRYRNK